MNITDIMPSELPELTARDGLPDTVLPIAAAIDAWSWFTGVRYLPGWTSISLLDPTGERLPITLWADGGDEDGWYAVALRAAEWNLAGRGVHLNMGSRRDRPDTGRGTRELVNALSSLWVDIDDPSDGVFNTLIDFKPTPCAISFTGGGYHAYWTILPFVEGDDIARWERIIRALDRVCGGNPERDGGALTSASGMRVPGTINTKPGRGQVVGLVYAAGIQQVYTIDDFAWLDPGKPVIRPMAPRVAANPDDLVYLSPDEIASAIGLGREQKHGQMWMVPCPNPGHGKGKGDHTPSLSIGRGANGSNIFKCHAHCDTRDVVNIIATMLRVPPAAVYGRATRPMTMAEMRAATRR